MQELVKLKEKGWGKALGSQTHTRAGLCPCGHGSRPAPGWARRQQANSHNERGGQGCPREMRCLCRPVTSSQSHGGSRAHPWRWNPLPRDKHSSHLDEGGRPRSGGRSHVRTWLLPGAVLLTKWGQGKSPSEPGEFQLIQATRNRWLSSLWVTRCGDWRELFSFRNQITWFMSACPSEPPDPGG